jgi:hypothetical protein
LNENRSDDALSDSALGTANVINCVLHVSYLFLKCQGKSSGSTGRIVKVLSGLI